jgi:hypothetical protein
LYKVTKNVKMRVCVCVCERERELSKAEQSRAGQSRAEQGRAGQSRAGQGRQSRVKQSRAEKNIPVLTRVCSFAELHLVLTNLLIPILKAFMLKNYLMEVPLDISSFAGLFLVLSSSMVNS